MALPVIYTQEEAAAYLRMAPETLRKKVYNKLISCVKSGRNSPILFSEDHLKEYIERFTQTSKGYY